MDAVKENLYRVFFGGSYRECWGSDEIMNGLIDHAMAEDFSFALSAEEYARTYLWML